MALKHRLLAGFLPTLLLAVATHGVAFGAPPAAATREDNLEDNELDGRDFARWRLQLRQDPKDIGTWLRLAQAYLEAGYFEEARAGFFRAVALDYLVAEAHFGLGSSELALANDEGALFSFNEVARLFPQRFDGHYNRAVSLARLGRINEAAAAFREAVVWAQGEDLLSARLGLAGQLKVLGDYEGAADVYAEALAVEARPDLIFLRGEALFQAGRGLEALPDLTTLAADEAEAGGAPVSALIADIYLEAGRSDYALRALERSLAYATVSGDALGVGAAQFRLGLVYRELGQTAKAISAFEAASRADPALWQALYNLALAFLEAGQTQSALEALQSALAIAESGELYLGVAAVQDQLDSPEALASARLALERLSDPALRAEASFVAARARYREGDYLLAQAVMEEVIAAQPGDAHVQLWAGLVQYGLGNFAAAAGFFEQAVLLDPNGSGGGAARLNLGAAYLASGRYQDAEFVYRLMVAEAEDGEAYYYLGWALLSQGRREEARSAWQRASALGDERAQADLGRHF